MGRLKTKIEALGTVEKDLAVLKTEKNAQEQMFALQMKELTENAKQKEQGFQSSTAELKKAEGELKKLQDEQQKQNLLIEKQKQQLEQFTKELASYKDIQNKALTLKTQLESIQSQAGEKDRELAQLRAQVEELRKDQASINQETRKIEQALQKEIKNGEIVVDKTPKQIKVLMMEKVLFRKREVSLTPQGEEILKKIAGVLKNVEDKQIFVMGHADSDPVTDPIIQKFFPTNWEFSVMRSVMVVRYLSEILKVDPRMFTAAGRSFYHPIREGKNEEAKSMNRRTEILIFPQFEKVKESSEGK
ncbi:MAG: hypothetical protein CVV50_02415 [Spirochaetae bacterium HGW-Spirochaetae-6]|nr:MAG: hypothetical protein CVV50_02415 [Spirochaetae bacterium HGW-Spirochaetae-6]